MTANWDGYFEVAENRDAWAARYIAEKDRLYPTDALMASAFEHSTMVPPVETYATLRPAILGMQNEVAHERSQPYHHKTRAIQHISDLGGETVDFDEWGPEPECPICGKHLTVRYERDLYTCAAIWPEPATILHGHTDAETAYAVEDYPYGFVLRTTLYAWIETREKKGQRFVTMTRNPKSGRLNKPKASTYAEAMLLHLDTDGHIGYTALSVWPSKCELHRFRRLAGETLTDYHQAKLREWEVMNQASKYITYEVRVARPGEPRETEEQVAAVWGAAIGQAQRDLGV